MTEEDKKIEEPEIEVLPARQETPSDEGGRSVQRGKQNIIIGTLNLFADPARGAFIEPIERRYFRYYQPERPHGWRHLVVDVLLAIAVVGLVGYNLALYIGFGKTLVPGIRLAIERKGELVSGTTITYVVTVANENRERLERTTLALELPPALAHIVADPSDGFNAKTKTWSLGAIESQGSVEMRLRANVLGAIDENVQVGATLAYTPEGSEKTERVSVRDEGSVREGTFLVTADIPERVINRQSLTLTLRYVNRGSFTLERVALQPIFPQGFTLERAEPALTKGVFVLERIAPETQGAVTMTGVLDGKGQESVAFPMRVVVSGATRDVDQGETVFTLPILYPTLEAAVHIDTPSIHPGEPTTYTVAFENTGKNDVLDAMITIAFPAAFLDAKTFVSSGATLDGTIVRMNKKTNPALALVRPRGKGEVTFTVASRMTFDQRVVLTKETVKLPLTVTASYRSEPDVDVVIPNTTTIEIPVGAALNLQSFARYYTDEGEQLGRGPLPPVVGKTTRYWIFWNIVNQVNEVNAVVVRGTLPAGVAWTGKVSTTYGDAVKFDPGSNAILWNVDVVKRETGGIYPDVGASFEVALTPDIGAAGKPALLLQDQRIQGKDTVTAETIEKDIPDMTTILKHDPLATGKGAVRSP